MKLKTVTVEQLVSNARKLVNDAHKRPIVVQSAGMPPLILRALADDDAADELLIQNPRFRAGIRAARRRHAAGKSVPLAEVRKRLKI